MAHDSNKGQFDGFQIVPGNLGSDWQFTNDEVHGNRQPSGKISNFQYYFVGTRMSQDRTRTTLGNPAHEAQYKIDGGVWEAHDGYLGHGVDWGLFNYNPYGRQNVWGTTASGLTVGQNPNFRVLNDWLNITGLGDITVVTDDVTDKDEVDASGMVQFRNYPTEGYNSFGKKGDKRWKWQGNSWVPGESDYLLK